MAKEDKPLIDTGKMDILLETIDQCYGTSEEFREMLGKIPSEYLDYAMKRKLELMRERLKAKEAFIPPEIEKEITEKPTRSLRSFRIYDRQYAEIKKAIQFHHKMSINDFVDAALNIVLTPYRDMFCIDKEEVEEVRRKKATERNIKKDNAEINRLESFIEASDKDKELRERPIPWTPEQVRADFNIDLKADMQEFRAFNDVMNPDPQPIHIYFRKVAAHFGFTQDMTQTEDWDNNPSMRHMKHAFTEYCETIFPNKRYFKDVMLPTEMTDQAIVIAYNINVLCGWQPQRFPELMTFHEYEEEMRLTRTDIHGNVIED